jgi:hypothetical protein
VTRRQMGEGKCMDSQWSMFECVKLSYCMLGHLPNVCLNVLSRVTGC